MYNLCLLCTWPLYIYTLTLCTVKCVYTRAADSPWPTLPYVSSDPPGLSVPICQQPACHGGLPVTTSPASAVSLTLCTSELACHKHWYCVGLLQSYAAARSTMTAFCGSNMQLEFSAAWIIFPLQLSSTTAVQFTVSLSSGQHSTSQHRTTQHSNVKHGLHKRFACGLFDASDRLL